MVDEKNKKESIVITTSWGNSFIAGSFMDVDTLSCYLFLFLLIRECFLYFFQGICELEGT
jgi:hypothetical protein